MKLKIAAISALMAMTVITTTILLGQNATSEPIIATGVPVSHVVEINSFVYTTTFGDKHSSSEQYPVAALDNPGNYCHFDDQALNNTSFNTNGHLIEATGFSSNSFLLMLSQNTISDNPRFLTKEDSYDESKRINLFGFADFTRMDFRLGEGNQAGLYSGDNKVTCDFDEGTKTYSLTGDFNSFAYFGPSFINVGSGTKVVIDKITLYYNC